jgi:hypothetical protein
LYNNTVGVQVGDSATDPTIVVTNTIISESATYTYFIEDVSAGQAITGDNNCFFGDTAASEFRRDLTLASNDTMNFATWQSTTGQDSGSLRADPKFVSSTDFRLFSDSPCLGLGANPTFPLGRQRYHRFGNVGGRRAG